uniref:Glycine--tRNA ligase n=1 Tax=Syphacia muris TaxID=451379 RepID=A0A0N5AS54_9BILA
MASPEVEAKLAPLRAAVREYGDLVRQLKTEGAAKVDIDKAVGELKARKKILEAAEVSLVPKDATFDRVLLEDLLRRRFFYDQSFALYGGVSGLYDFGPMGCALKANLIQLWRKHFVLEEGMLEVGCSMLTPLPVLKASGHVDRFADLMVKDSLTGECFRADHLIKNLAEKLLKDEKTDVDLRNELTEMLARIDGFNKSDIKNVIDKYSFKSPSTGNPLLGPEEFNLMFKTSIGTKADSEAFLRPETAQGIFVNFKRLLEFNQGKLPFAAAQIGSAFRNEISPRQGLIRVREFDMCEIEHFVDPDDKRHPRFSRVSDQKIMLFSACNQLDGKPAQSFTVGDAVNQKIIANEMLGYYMAREQQFLVKVGIDPARLRFRQHLSNEMAHYARDCWDAEILTSYGWVECIGNADRACYDLQQHQKATGVKLTAERNLKEPKTVEIVKVVPNKAAIAENSAVISIDSKNFTITKDMVTVKHTTKKVHVEEIVPSVIEPSFGIGRIMYAVLEHAFRKRDGDEQRNFLALAPGIAPIKCSILPISSNAKFEPILEAVQEELKSHEISYKQDDSSGSIGRRYARTDEIGIPFGITVDFESELQPWTVTLRYALTLEQVRLQVSEVGQVVSQLCNGKICWNDVQNQYPKFE